MQRITWNGFLRRNRRDPEASMLLTIGGRSPSETLRRIERAEVMRPDFETYQSRIETLEKWREQYDATAPIVDERDPADWQELGNGARMRRVHRDSERRA